MKGGGEGWVYVILLLPNSKDQMMYASLDLHICVMVEMKLLSPFPRQLLAVSRFPGNEEETIMTAEKSMQRNPQ